MNQEKIMKRRMIRAIVLFILTFIALLVFIDLALIRKYPEIKTKRSTPTLPPNWIQRIQQRFKLMLSLGKENPPSPA